MYTAAQYRAARALLGLTLEESSKASGLPVSVISDCESDRLAQVEDIAARTLRRAYEAKGIVFVNDGDGSSGGAGVRFAARDLVERTIRPENLNAANDD